ncbi:putative protein kinase [Leptomonas pyrrhocoris]|uniref:Protein kinase domain-containing protein n=1 Tax=Leptomonas pyrrhocoris TaxID=157538 RepID=A0A0N0E0L4_LEPPY|nr:putative protein kinase [Leptomonas pyrrhocoris]KPA86568.1 putative protein kinase [Leptomonas pyrrhocoris]|eukprot:XP_015665007.1 putative protein kinase [Leptomonas pyrrhocoris]
MATTSAEVKASEKRQWTYKIAKSSVYPTSLDAINDRVAALRPLSAQPNAGVLPVIRAYCSPLYLCVDVDEQVAVEQLGAREQFVPFSSSAASPTIPDEEASAVVLAVAETLSRLHARGVVHGHVHVDVVRRHVADPRRVVLLEAELPMSALVPQGVVGAEARRCAAPEILRGAPYGGAADVWGLGVLLLQLLSEQAKTCSTADLVDSDLLSPFLSTLSPQALSFVLPCLKGDSSARPLLWNVMQHPFLASFREMEMAGVTDTTGRSPQNSSSSSTEVEADTDDESDEESTSGDSF